MCLVKIVIISDTHGLHEDLPEIDGDILIHCGDFEQTAEIDAWFDRQSFSSTIVVPGNHDHDAAEKHADIQPVFFNAEMLLDRTVEISGLKFYGSPWINELEGAAFSLDHEQILEKWQAIPDDTDVLITHVPPLRILDLARNGENWGCELLAQRVSDLNLRFHCFGHVHHSYGIEDRNGVTFVNASSISGGEIRNPPVTLDL